MPQTHPAHTKQQVDAVDPAPQPPRRRALLRWALGGAGSVVMPSVLTSHSGVASAPPPARLPPPPPVRSNASAPDIAEWMRFAARFITPEGRVVDTGQGYVSHSEGQGYALLLAEWAQDRDSFERILGWTLANLRRPGDTLFAWRWKPGVMVPVDDMNSATDGDLAIAWALSRAAERWHMPRWADHSAAIGHDILQLSTRDMGGRLYLMPGPVGFDRPDRIIINPSYYHFPAIRALARGAGDERWARLNDDGMQLLGNMRYGRWGLPADWVDIRAVTGSMAPAAGWPARFSWDAVRVPLHLAWAGETAAPALHAAAAFWTQQGWMVGNEPRVPAWSDLASGQLAPYAGHAGIQSVAELSLAVMSGRGRRPAFGMQTAMPDYYAAALALLSRMAWQEAGAVAQETALRIATR